MKKLTLQFTCLHDLSAFSKGLTTGFLMNTTNLTLTGILPELKVNMAKENFGAITIPTTDKVYSYDPILN